MDDVISAGTAGGFEKPIRNGQLSLNPPVAIEHVLNTGCVKAGFDLFVGIVRSRCPTMTVPIDDLVPLGSMVLVPTSNTPQPQAQAYIGSLARFFKS
jgi:hypothetical protein